MFLVFWFSVITHWYFPVAFPACTRSWLVHMLDWTVVHPAKTSPFPWNEPNPIPHSLPIPPSSLKLKLDISLFSCFGTHSGSGWASYVCSEKWVKIWTPSLTKSLTNSLSKSGKLMNSNVCFKGWPRHRISLNPSIEMINNTGINQL